MKLLAENQRTYGLLAYSGEVCVGWIAVDPVSDLVGHDLQATGKEHEWSIHCIFVREGYRGKGLSTQLIQAAVEYARAKGAKIISAFPIPSENRKRFPENEAEFSGRLSTYQKLGFTSSGPSTDFYQRMELE
jgi:GNAT superfamily N-acetyltransferase